MQYIKDSLDAYIEKRFPTGGFLQVVLCNDLMRACQKADMHNQYRLAKIMTYIYNNLPTVSYGSPEKVEKWLNRKELE